MALGVGLIRRGGIKAEPIMGCGGVEDEEGEGGQFSVWLEPCEDMGEEGGLEEEMEAFGGKVGGIKALGHPLSGEPAEGIGGVDLEERILGEEPGMEGKGEPCAVVVASFFGELELGQGDAEGAGPVEKAVGG